MKTAQTILAALAIVTAAAAAASPSVDLSRGRLKVSDNNRYLVHEDGTPFFYLGDTAWQLFHRLDRDQADMYLENRRHKGFTVIQAVALPLLGGLDSPNAYGDTPLLNGDPTRPNEAFFDHVDYIVSKANDLGLVVGLLPTWGNYWKYRHGKPTLFTPETARTYGEFIGSRYRDNAIIWILGGDENIDNDRERATVTAIAEGLREGDGGSHLITFHPRGPGLSSDYFHSAEWLNLNMYQSSHAAHDHDNGLFAEHDYALQPPKPTLDGEPRYEHLVVGFYFSNYNRYDRFDAYDVRQAAYWSLLAGACGHTYGNSAVWQMYEPQHESAIFANVPWYEALDHPGAFQMRFVRRLFESRPFEKLIPDQAMILDGPRTGGAKIRAAVASDGSFAFIYSPRGEKFTIDKNRIRALRTKEIWYDPRYGCSYPIHTPDTKGFQTFTPPTSGRGNDWLLILEDAEAKFPLPGPPTK
jgi:hypothetical protein